jgi:hypothetical protein
MTAPKAKPAEEEVDLSRPEWRGVSEDHAIDFPGHSVTTILGLSINEDGEGIAVLRVACNGSPDAYINGERDCEWYEEIPLP